MTTYHEFDQLEIQNSLDNVAQYHKDNPPSSSLVGGVLSDDGHLSFAAAQCISLTVEDNKVCLNLPFNIGQVCLPIPPFVPNGTAASACLDICTTWGIPTGIKVTVSALNRVVIRKSFGKC